MSMWTLLKRNQITIKKHKNMNISIDLVVEKRLRKNTNLLSVTLVLLLEVGFKSGIVPTQVLAKSCCNKDDREIEG